jgi:hypothetical protein
MSRPLSKRPGYREGSGADELQRDLDELRKKHGLIGVVLVEFTRDRVGVRSCGESDLFGRTMDTLARRILTDIDDGRHDPLEHMTAEGRG